MRDASQLCRAAVIALICAAGAGASIHASASDFTADDDRVGELVGELMFRADLLASLDALCPRRGPSRDWHADLPDLPPEATTLELLDLSRRLGADAGQQILRDHGGCTTRAFASAYEESRQTFSQLIERWQQL